MTSPKAVDAATTVGPAPNTAASRRGTRDLHGLFAEFAPFNQRWADRDKLFSDRLAAIAPGLNPTPRLDLIRTYAEWAIVLNNSQLSAISVMAGFAREHQGAWRLAVTQLQQSYQLHQFHLAEVERAEKRNARVRKNFLEIWSARLETPPTPPTPAPAVAADDEARVSDRVARLLELPSDADIEKALTQPLGPGIDDELTRSFLTGWRRLLLEQTTKDKERAGAAKEEFTDLVGNQRKQLEIGQAAVERRDAYRNNGAIGLVSVGLLLVVAGHLIGARTIYVPGSEVVVSSFPWQGTYPLIAASIVTLLAAMVSVAGVSIVVLRSATMEIRDHPAAKNIRNRSKRLIVFMVIFVLVVIVYALNSVLILISDNRVVGLIAAPILLGLGIGMTTFVLIYRRPRTLASAAELGSDESLGVTELDTRVASGRYAQVLRSLRNLSLRREKFFEHQATHWGRVMLWLGIPATILTGLGAATAFTNLTDNGPLKYIIASLALIGSTLAGVATSLNAGGKAEAAAARAGSFEALGRELGVARTLDLRDWTEAERRRSSVEDFMARINVLENVKDQTSLYSRQHPPKSESNGIPSAAVTGTGANAAALSDGTVRPPVS